MKVKKVNGRLLDYQSRKAATQDLEYAVMRGELRPMSAGTILGMFVDSHAEERFWESDLN